MSQKVFINMTPKPIDLPTLTDFDFDKVNISTEPSSTLTTSTSDLVPIFNIKDNLHAPINMDINKIVNKVWEKRKAIFNSTLCKSSFSKSYREPFPSKR